MRLEMLDHAGYFGHPSFSLPQAFKCMAVAPILEALCEHERRFADFEDPVRNDVRYTFDNRYFTSPDAEVLYTIVRTSQPRTVVEVGCGHSTRIIRQAIVDSPIPTRLLSIDPHPRLDIKGLVDELYLTPVEALGNMEIFQSLREGDILFIDSSHDMKTGSDVAFLYLHVLPALAHGVLIHIHDVFLPYDYPREWVIEKCWSFNEQYLVQSMLMGGDGFEVLWAGHFLQRTRTDFCRYFPYADGRVAKSLWLRKTT